MGSLQIGPSPISEPDSEPEPQHWHPAYDIRRRRRLGHGPRGGLGAWDLYLWLWFYRDMIVLVLARPGPATGSHGEPTDSDSAMMIGLGSSESPPTRISEKPDIGNFDSGFKLTQSDIG